MTTTPGIAIPPQVMTALQRASRSTGVQFDYLLRTAQRESAFKTNIKSNTSSATGLFQFIEQTWFHMIKKDGHAAGLGNMANAIERTAGGRYKVADPKMRSAILALRKNPDVASQMAGRFARDNGDVLAKALGRPATSGDLYIAHFLGVNGGGQTDRHGSVETGHARFRAVSKSSPGQPVYFLRQGGPCTQRKGGLPKPDLNIQFQIHIRRARAYPE